jgi:Icc-related predicted phosphoesterase
MAPRLLWNRLRHGRYLDILITHAPPFGIHDGPDLCHRGFRAFLTFMRWFRPRYLIHGHKHVYRPDEVTQTSYHQTEVINTYGYRILEMNHLLGRTPQQVVETRERHD